MKITDIFAPIEKFITEHGSAAIQEKHIAFLREQLSILKEKFGTTERTLQDCQSKQKELEAQNADLRQQIEAFKRPPPQPRWGSQPRIKGRMER